MCGGTTLSTRLDTGMKVDWIDAVALSFGAHFSAARDASVRVVDDTPCSAGSRGSPRT